jgi:1,4-alpha-glucan branching enzyme
MSLSLDEVRLLCTKAEYSLVAESRTPAIEQLTAMKLKTNTANARKLVDKWQKLSRGQSRDESRKTGEPDLASKTYTKHQVMHEALEAYQARLAVVATTASVEASAKKLTPRERTASARVSRQSARTELQGVKKTVNKVAKARSIQAAKKAAPVKAAPVKAAPVKAAPVKAAPVKAAPVKAAVKAAPAKAAPVKATAVKASTKKAPASKSEAAKKTLVKTAAKRTAKRAEVASSAPALAVPKKVVKTTAKPGIVAATPAAKAQLAASAKSNRVKLSNRSSNIAGHVSAKGKRAQAKRDSKGR